MTIKAAKYGGHDRRFDQSQFPSLNHITCVKTHTTCVKTHTTCVRAFYSRKLLVQKALQYVRREPVVRGKMCGFSYFILIIFRSSRCFSHFVLCNFSDMLEIMKDILGSCPCSWYW